MIAEKIKQYEKCNFDLTQKHKVISNVEKDILIIEDTKFYKNKTRKDILQIKISELQKRIAKIKLFDRKSFEAEFKNEASNVLCCNSFAVAKNLANKNQQYSTCYRILARVANRADLMLMCEMSNANQNKIFNSNRFNDVIKNQISTLKKDEIIKANTTKENYKTNVEKLKKLFLLNKTSKAKTSKLVKAKTKIKQIA